MHSAPQGQIKTQVSMWFLLAPGVCSSMRVLVFPISYTAQLLALLRGEFGVYLSFPEAKVIAAELFEVGLGEELNRNL